MLFKKSKREGVKHPVGQNKLNLLKKVEKVEETKVEVRVEEAEKMRVIVPM
jgi:hypothetical protein